MLYTDQSVLEVSASVPSQGAARVDLGQEVGQGLLEGCEAVCAEVLGVLGLEVRDDAERLGEELAATAAEEFPEYNQPER